MKTIMVWIGAFALVLIALPQAGADRLNLQNPKSLTPTTTQRANWRIVLVDEEARKVIVQVEWLAPGDVGISVGGRTSQSFVCRDIPTPGENRSCAAVAVPFPCCTGLGTGTCDGLDDDCFTATFGFQIRQEDVGTRVGVLQRQLLFQKWRQQELEPGNNATFE